MSRTFTRESKASTWCDGLICAEFARQQTTPTTRPRPLRSRLCGPLLRKSLRKSLRFIPKKERTILRKILRLIGHPQSHQRRDTGCCAARWRSCFHVWDVVHCLIHTVGSRGAYRGASLMRNRRPLGLYSRPMPRALWTHVAPKIDGSVKMLTDVCHTEGF